jgi:hypothetical protein
MSDALNAPLLHRIAKGAAPVIAVLCLLSVAEPDPIGQAAMFTAAALILWFGWRWMRLSRPTKWVGILLAALVALVGVSLYARIAVPVLLVVVVPVLVYDLFFAQPWKGRYARAREARRLARTRPVA